jgi:hypothetical protein
MGILLMAWGKQTGMRPEKIIFSVTVSSGDIERQ